MHTIAIIPARLGSTRLPRKVLREIAGRPMLAWVHDAARSSPLVSDVIVATDSEEVITLCERNGWHARMTSSNHCSGTDRVYEVACSIPADVYVNVQGDEPLARREHLEALLTPMSNPSVVVSTIKTPATPTDIQNPNAVKVVTDSSGWALYFSRSTIPYDREGTSNPRYFKHLGFYAYRKSALQRFCALPESSLERSEKLEQLRFLENGIAIYVAETAFDTIGVDTEKDLRTVERQLLARR
jgi:3-deoxy-manno-octulosonate cytidylyltransferase (CMP-KDO synthetase)